MRPSRICAGVIDRHRAAASSIARGTPSRRLADRRDGGSVAVIDGEAGTHVLGTVEEQADTVELRQRGHRKRRAVRGGTGHRWDTPCDLPRNLQRHPTRREDTDRWAPPQELVHRERDDLHQVLAVVEDEKHLLLGEHMGERVRGARADLSSHADRAGDRRDRQVGVADILQLDPPRAVLRLVDNLRRRLERETGLARTSGAHDCDQTIRRGGDSRRLRCRPSAPQSSTAG